jgi:transketolase
MGSIRAKFEAFDWDVIDILKEMTSKLLSQGMTDAKSRRKGKPVCVLLHTEMGMELIS